MRPAIVALAFALLLSGCAHSNAEFKTIMDSRIGILTFDDAIRKWGPPTNVAEGDRVIVSKWTRSLGTSVAYTRGIAYGAETTNNLTIAFDRNTKKMIEWTLAEE